MNSYATKSISKGYASFDYELIDSEVADDFDRSVIHEQVEMGVAVRMACLDILTRTKNRNVL